jgi:hypothetical protein
MRECLADRRTGGRLREVLAQLRVEMEGAGVA